MTLVSFFKFFTRNRFRKEIVLIILIKLVALFLLWRFFLAPIDKSILTPPALLDHYVTDQFPSS